MPSNVRNNPFAMPDPLMIKQQIQQQRQQMWGSGNVAAMHQATVGNALDSLFGNPMVKRAKQVQERVKTAEANVHVQEGDDDVTSELRRLTAIRDAVVDLDPSMASQLNGYILELGTMKLERDKLKAQTASSNASASKNLVTAQTALSEDARETAAFPLEIDRTLAATESSRAAAASSRSLVAHRDNEIINLINRQSGHSLGVKASNQTLVDQLLAAGYEAAGKTTIQGSSDEVTQIRPGDRSKELIGLREQAVASAKLAGALGETIKLIDANPNAGTLPAQVTNFARTAKENLLASFKANGVARADLTREGVSVDQLVGNSLPRADAQLRGMVTTLVYAQARAADPGGRLSNQDVEMFAKQFGAMSPQQMRDTMVRLLMQGERDLTIAATALGARDDDAVNVALAEFARTRESSSPAVERDGKDLGNGVIMRIRERK